MKNLFAIGLLVFTLTMSMNSADAATRVIRTYNSVPNYSYDGYNSNRVYSNDLSRIENYLFGTTYKKEATASRLNRIERRLFNRNYPSMNLAQRMNNVLSNYRDDYNNKNYLADYYSNTTPASRIRNRFIGQPTGFTPPIVNTPFGINSFSPTFSRGYANNRGYAYRNTIPAMTGAGIHILD